MNSTSKQIKVLVADDHPLLREGIAALISTQPDMILIGEAGSGAEAIRQFHLLVPDVVLMDLQMPDINGVDAILAIREAAPDAHIIVLTTYEGDVLANRALTAGAQAYLLKATVRRDLADTIRAVHRGQKRIEPTVATQLAIQTSKQTLSPREIEVLRLIAVGESNRAIATQLGINEETVKSHVKNILAKLDARNGTHAVALALRRGIIEI
jgi:DNA-binding NarL/FixJ family response regulator